MVPHASVPARPPARPLAAPDIPRDRANFSANTVTAGGSSSPGHSVAAVQRGYWGPPIHNMGLCGWPGEDPNAWKQFGPETTGQ
jgi:hypothetical protein